MSACLMIGAALLSLSGDGFDLRWRHSVERTEWRESWRITDGALVLYEAAVKGSGAGMDPGPGARLQGGWWVWTPETPAVGEVLLAASGATGGGWQICDGAACQTYGAEAGAALRLSPCAKSARAPR